MKNTKIKVLLLEQRKSQRWLSKKTGIPEAHLSMAIHGRYVLDDQQKKSISKVLCTPTNEIFSNERQPLV